jgi:hypothetical protein
MVVIFLLIPFILPLPALPAFLLLLASVGLYFRQL